MGHSDPARTLQGLDDQREAHEGLSSAMHIRFAGMPVKTSSVVSSGRSARGGGQRVSRDSVMS